MCGAGGGFWGDGDVALGQRGPRWCWRHQCWTGRDIQGTTGHPPASHPCSPVAHRGDTGMWPPAGTGLGLGALRAARRSPGALVGQAPKGQAAWHRGVLGLLRPASVPSRLAAPAASVPAGDTAGGPGDVPRSGPGGCVPCPRGVPGPWVPGVRVSCGGTAPDLAGPHGVAGGDAG